MLGPGRRPIAIENRSHPGALRRGGGVSGDRLWGAGGGLGAAYPADRPRTTSKKIENTRSCFGKSWDHKILSLVSHDPSSKTLA